MVSRRSARRNAFKHDQHSPQAHHRVAGGEPVRGVVAERQPLVLTDDALTELVKWRVRFWVLVGILAAAHWQHTCGNDAPRPYIRTRKSRL